MTRNFREIGLSGEYSSSGASLVQDFFSPVLESARTYDRAAGYFSSSLFVLAPVAWTDFFFSGGKMKLLSSVELSGPDAQNLSGGHLPDERFRSSFEEAWANLISDPTKELTASLLRALIYFEKLEVKVAIFRKKGGLFHDKLGIFRDSDGHAVSFTGSANETWNAWSGFGNHESIDVFRSWEGKDSERVNSHISRFDQYWNGERKDLIVFGGEALREVVVEKEPTEDLEAIVKRVRFELERAIKSVSVSWPSANQPKKLREYQLEAVENWVAHNNRGVISFATGGGKTLTAIEVIRRWASLGGSTLVLVPTGILASQWIKELISELPTATILRADSRSRSPWKKLINTFLSGSESAAPRVVVGTYKTAAGKAFRSLVGGGRKLLVIGDEVHRFGAPDTRKIAEHLSSGATLGLSATPLRSFDDEGTEAIFGYFGSQLSPIYSLTDAIADGNLVPYRFKYVTARLNEVEQMEWDALTLKIRRATGQDADSFEGQSAYVKTLRMNRARITKTAESKIFMAATIVAGDFEAHDRWLVYCETEDHLALIAGQIREIRQDLTLMKYTSTNEDEHDRVLSHFNEVGGVLLAIRCLDEGVDIPTINKAIIVSSSQSPREFIQRRGRVLRRAPDKPLAHLYDFLMEDNLGEVLSSAELERLIEFAKDAMNKEPHSSLSYRRKVAGRQKGEAN
jgi:superfamily II DNA or RNA helicase